MAVWLVLGALLSAHGEEPVRRHFNLPEGPAISTLKRAAQMAGIEIVYSAAAVSGVTTNTVIGDFTPLEALERLVANTPLRLHHDVETAAFSVIRQPESESPKPRPSATPPNSSSMKRSTPLAAVAAWFALAFGSTHAADGPAAATGAVSGRVQNVATGQFLNNARFPAQWDPKLGIHVT